MVFASPNPPPTRSEVTRHRGPQRAILRNEAIFRPFDPNKFMGISGCPGVVQGCGEGARGSWRGASSGVGVKKWGPIHLAHRQAPPIMDGGSRAGNSELGMRPRQEREAKGGRETKPRGQGNQADKRAKKRLHKGAFFRWSGAEERT